MTIKKSVCGEPPHTFFCGVLYVRISKVEKEEIGVNQNKYIKKIFFL